MQLIVGMATLLPVLASFVAWPGNVLSRAVITESFPFHVLLSQGASNQSAVDNILTRTFPSGNVLLPEMTKSDNAQEIGRTIDAADLVKRPHSSYDNSFNSISTEALSKSSALNAVGSLQTAPREAIQEGPSHFSGDRRFETSAIRQSGSGDGGSGAVTTRWVTSNGTSPHTGKEASSSSSSDEKQPTKEASSKPGRWERQHTVSTNTSEDADSVSYYIENIFLWTRYYNSAVGYEVLDLDDLGSLANSHFVISSPTIILVHGFLSHGLIDWIQSIKDKFIARENCNVISVHWSAGTSSAQYYTITTRVPYVGEGIARLVSQMYFLKHVRPDQVYLVGHSLGAHVAGFVGKKNKLDPIGRITGLDPAGLTYDDTDGSVRLDKRDANYVDIIHTNGCVTLNKWLDCFGIINSVGHTDFWPNGGKYQPACRSARRREHQQHRGGNEDRTDQFVGCDHEMAYKYYMESLDYSDSTTFYLSRPNDTSAAVGQLNSTCGHFPQYMGYLADPSYGGGDYYLMTRDRPPYAVQDNSCPSRHTTVGLSTMTRWFIGFASAGLGTGIVIVPIAMLLSRRSRAADDRPLLPAEQEVGGEAEESSLAPLPEV